MEEQITYMGYMWIQLDGGVLTIGVNEDGVDELGEDLSVDLPELSDTVTEGQVCGEISSEQGPLNIYCPVDGQVLEINEAVVENPGLIQEDCLDDGWLLKVEADDPSSIDMVSLQNPDDGEDEELEPDMDEDE